MQSTVVLMASNTPYANLFYMQHKTSTYTIFPPVRLVHIPSFVTIRAHLAAVSMSMDVNGLHFPRLPSICGSKVRRISLVER